MTYVEAAYADGYTHSELELNDVSPYVAGRNIFNDILEKRPEAEHGRMVRFSLVHELNRYDIDWSTIPDNARPIRFKHMRMDFDVTNGSTYTYLDGIDFGYQYNDENGQNVQRVMKI